MWETMLDKKQKDKIMENAFSETMSKKDKKKTVYWDELFMTNIISLTEQAVLDEIEKEMNNLFKESENINDYEMKHIYEMAFRDLKKRIKQKQSEKK